MISIPRIRVYFSPTTNPGDADVPVEISDRVLAMHIDRGRPARGQPVIEMQKIPPGKATLTLDNKGRVFDPLYTGGPYYGNLEPSKRLWVEMGENLISNPSFEVNNNGWTTVGSATRVSDTTTSFDGARSLEIDSNGGANFGQSFSVSGLTVGQTYTASVRVKTNAGGVGITFRLSADATGSPLTNASLTTGWQKVTLTFVASATTHILSFLMITTLVKSFWLDAAQLVPGLEQPYVPAPMRRFTGEIEGWPQSWKGRTNQVQLTVLGATDSLADALVTPGLVISSGLPGAHINAVLDDIGVGAGSSYRLIDAGETAIAGHTFGANEYGIDYAQQVALTEQGYLFEDVYNRIVFLQKHKQIQAPYTTVQAIFANDPAAGEHPFEDVDNPDWSAKLVRNRVTVTPVGAPAQTYEDATSKQKYRVRAASMASLHGNPNEAFDTASFLVYKYKSAQPFVGGLVVTPQEDEDGSRNAWAVMLGLDLASRIRAKIQPPGPAGLIDKEGVIQAISEDYTRENGYIMSIDTIPPYPVWPMWYLGVAGQSELGTTTYVGY